MNAVFVVLTSYQLMVANTYAEYIYEAFHQKSKIILVGLDVKVRKFEAYSLVNVPNLEHGKIRRAWKRLFYGGNLFALSPLKRQISKVKNSYIFVFNDIEPVTNKLIRFFKKKNNKIVLVEEGIGTYAVSCVHKKTIKEKIRVLCTSLLGSKMQYRAIGDNKLIDFVIVWNDKLYKTLDKANNKVILHQSKKSIFCYSKNFLQSYYGKLVDKLECDILLLGQPVVENSGMIIEEYEFLNSIINLIGNYKVIIKPHPRDINEKYNKLADEFDNVAVLDNQYSSIPIECLVASCNPKFIIAHSSSAVINIANMMPTVKAIMLYKLDSCGELNKRIFGENRNYNEAIFISTNDNLYKPKSLTELKYLLENNSTIDKLTNEKYGANFPEIDFLCAL